MNNEKLCHAGVAGSLTESDAESPLAASSGLVNSSISRKPRIGVSTAIPGAHEGSLVITKYATDSRVSLSGFVTATRRRATNRKTKTAIGKFTPASWRTLKTHLRNTKALWTTTTTLSYPTNHAPKDGRALKQQIDALTHWLRRKGRRYLWLIEFQESGAPHIHMLLSGRIDKSALAQKWFDVVGSGNPQHLRAGTRVEAVRDTDRLVSYLLKRNSPQKILPQGCPGIGRWWGCSRGILESKKIVIRGDHDTLARMIRPMRRWKQTRARKGQKRWRWFGHGFTLWGGAGLISRLREVGLLPEALESSEATAQVNAKPQRAEASDMAPKTEHSVLQEHELLRDARYQLLDLIPGVSYIGASP